MAKDKTELTEAQVAFKNLMESYAKSNPVKFEAKKAELEDKLSRVESVVQTAKGVEFTFRPK